jgi:uncharacterized protein (TIGR00297 family)
MRTARGPSRSTGRVHGERDILRPVTSDAAHDMLSRLLLGLAAAGTVAAIAHRAGALTGRGAWAATAVGTACVAAGWDWGTLMVAFFTTSTFLSRVGHARKATLAAGVVAKAGPRDAAQVLANGGAFAACAVAYAFQRSPLWLAAGAGGLAAATADTWGTEVGMLAGGTPRSILSWRPVPAGTSGGITGIGTLASVVGAIVIGATARAVGWTPSAVWSAVIGGVGGATADSILGASLQARRWCDRCQATTERVVHACGAPTVDAGGVTWLDNDTVNVAGAAVGALTGLAAAWIAGRSGG